MGHGSRAALAGSLGFAVAFVVACGGQSGLLSSGQSSTLSSQLDAISAAVDKGHCNVAQNAAHEFENQVAALPSNVNTTLVQNLGQGASTVSQLAQDCTSSTSSTTTSSTTTSTSTTTPTTSTSTTSTSTTPTTSTSTSTSSTTTTGTNTSTTSTSNTGGGGPVNGGTGNTGAGGNQNGQ